MMLRFAVAMLLLCAAGATLAAGAEPVPLASPGLPAGSMDPLGRLVEDWGTVGVRVSGEGVAETPWAVEAVRLDDLLPAARAAADRGAVRVTLTAFRAPAFPAGVDVLSVRVEEAKGQAVKVAVALDLPEGVKRGLSTAKVENRLVLSVPRATLHTQQLRPWGYTNEATVLPHWAKPEGPADPAFTSIRAGMGGVPIRYSFQVEPGAKAQVVLGLCEGHWTKARKRPLVCHVEGAGPQEVDPVTEWGTNKPGAIVVRAQDADRDGRLEVSVRPVPGAVDRNTILNSLWLFPPGKPLDPAKVISGELNDKATYFVDVGGPGDQSIYPCDNLEFPLSLAPGEVKELTFYAACPRSDAPQPDQTGWTPQALRQAAAAVWKDWP
jgi:hypothetical protein